MADDKPTNDEPVDADKHGESAGETPSDEARAAGGEPEPKDGATAPEGEAATPGGEPSQGPADELAAPAPAVSEPATVQASSGRSGSGGRAVIAVAAAAALAVGLVVGWVGGAAGSDSDDDEHAGMDHADMDHADMDHADMDHSNMDHADMEDSDGDDDGLGALLADHHFHPPSNEPLDSEDRQLLTYQLSVVNRMIDDFPTVGDAQDADWRRAGPFIPGLGTHYIPHDRDLTFTIPSEVGNDEDGEEVRPLLIFEGLEEESPLVGFMFMAIGSEASPDGFASSDDDWHHHANICIVIDEEGDIELPFVADLDNVTEEMCEDHGGNMQDLSAQMVHVWSVPGYDSELGLFSEVNPLITCPDGTYHRTPYDQLEEPFDTACPA